MIRILLLKISKIIPIVLCLYLVPLRLMALNQVSHTFYFDANLLSIDTIVINDDSYINVNYDDFNKFGEVGHPSLPFKMVSFSVPYNAYNFRVTISNTQVGYCILSYPVVPQQPQNSSNEEEPPFLSPSDSIYSINSFYPSAYAKVESNGYCLGLNNVVNVMLFPVAVNTYNNRLNFCRKMKVTLRYDLSDFPLNMTPLTRVNIEDKQEDLETVKSMVINSSDVENFTYNGNSTDWNGWNYIDTTSNSMSQNPAYMGSDTCSLPCPKYIIITADSLKTHLKRLVAYKQLKGLSTEIVTVESILSHPFFSQGDKSKLGDTCTFITDSAGIIRAYLKYAFKKGSKYVLFAGKGVPFRYGQSDSLSTDDSYLPTDLYYSELSSNWNITNDGRYGIIKEYRNSFSQENEDKTVCFDYHPELYVGRLPASNLNQFNCYTDKLFRYELNPGAGDYEYLLKPFIYSMPSGGHVTSQLSYVDLINHELSAFAVFTTILRGSSYYHYPTGAQFIDVINQCKPGIVTFYAHGSPIAIKVDSYGNTNHHRVLALDEYDNGSSGINQSESLNGLDNIQNKYYPTIMLANSCTTMPFDIYANYNKMNMGESFVLGKDYGGPAYVGHTRASSDGGQLFPKVIRQLTYFYYEPKIGKALAEAKEGYNNLYADMITNLFGDPEMDVWTSYPQTFDTVQVKRQENCILITKLPSDAKKIISISSPSQSRTITVYEKNCTITDVNPNSNIMINHKKYIPYIAPLLVQNYEYNKSSYMITNQFIAGNHVDQNRTYGNVSVKTGTHCEIEILKDARLASGFKVERGALFKIMPSSADIYGIHH